MILPQNNFEIPVNYLVYVFDVICRGDGVSVITLVFWIDVPRIELQNGGKLMRLNSIFAYEPRQE
jgi:hypothetical protein